VEVRDILYCFDTPINTIHDKFTYNNNGKNG